MRSFTFILITSSYYFLSSTIRSTEATATSTKIPVQESKSTLNLNIISAEAAVPRQILNEEINKKVPRPPPRGSSRVSSTSNAGENHRNLQAFNFNGYDRKDAPGLSKDALKLDRSDYQDAPLIFSASPSLGPSVTPSSTTQPSETPSSTPSASPSVRPTPIPSGQPSSAPSTMPSSQPSKTPSSIPSASPSLRPTPIPSVQPSSVPSMSSSPTRQPSKTPSMVPSVSPSLRPTPIPSVEPSSGPTRQPSNEPSLYPTTTYRPTINDTFIPGQLLLAAYYYPWHGDDFHHGEGYLRKLLSPSQLPQLGEYDDRESHVLHYHLRWSRQANINLWITSWWGPDRRTDRTIRTHILRHDKLQNQKIAIFYETMGRMKKNGNFTTERIATDMEHLCLHYFDHPNYYTLEDSSLNTTRPVVFVYLTRVLTKQGIFEESIDIMRNTIRDACGKEVYIVGDQVFGKASNKKFDSDPNHYIPLQKLDAVTNYDVYGSIGQVNGGRGGILTEEQVRNYYEVEQALWKVQAEKFGCQYIPSVSPGYNDLGVRPENEHPPLSRSLDGMAAGSLLEVSLKHAIPLAGVSNIENRTVESHRLLVVNSFNEWHEDTQIEPTKGFPASLPINYTFGFVYEGYGDKYLEILRNGTEAEIDGLL